MKEALALEYIQIENMLKIEKERLETRKALLGAGWQRWWRARDARPDRSPRR
jgi:hypothetical protein